MAFLLSSSLQFGQVSFTFIQSKKHLEWKACLHVQIYLTGSLFSIWSRQIEHTSSNKASFFSFNFATSTIGIHLSKSYYVSVASLSSSLLPEPTVYPGI